MRRMRMTKQAWRLVFAVGISLALAGSATADWVETFEGGYDQTWTAFDPIQYQTAVPSHIWTTGGPGIDGDYGIIGGDRTAYGGYLDITAGEPDFPPEADIQASLVYGENFDKVYVELTANAAQASNAKHVYMVGAHLPDDDVVDPGDIENFNGYWVYVDYGDDDPDYIWYGVVRIAPGLDMSFYDGGYTYTTDKSQSYKLCGWFIPDLEGHEGELMVLAEWYDNSGTRVATTAGGPNGEADDFDADPLPAGPGGLAYWNNAPVGGYPGGGVQTEQTTGMDNVKSIVYVEGDFDCDGGVDAFDLLIWQNYFGTGSNCGPKQGDADWDGDNDAFDLLIWQNNFSAPSAVPEPSTLVLLAAGAVALAFVRRRGRRS
jgi:hypothetical protein